MEVSLFKAIVGSKLFFLAAIVLVTIWVWLSLDFGVKLLQGGVHNMLAIIVPSVVAIIGFIITIKNTNAQIKSAFSQHEYRLIAENKRQRELTVKEKAEETFSIIQEIMDEAQLIVREVTVFLSGARWSSQELQAAYWRLLKPINRLRLLLYLYFPRIAKTELDSIAAAYNLVADLRDYAVQHTDISVGNQSFTGAELIRPSGSLLDYPNFAESYSRKIETLNSFLDKFSKEVSKSLTADDFA